MVYQNPRSAQARRHSQALLDSGQFENRVALARYVGVSRARATQVLKRLNNFGPCNQAVQTVFGVDRTSTGQTFRAGEMHHGDVVAGQVHLRKPDEGSLTWLRMEGPVMWEGGMLC